MNHRHPLAVILLAVAGLAAGPVPAQDAHGTRGVADEATPSHKRADADATATREQPAAKPDERKAKPQQAKRKPPRRAVWQTIGPQPGDPPAPALTYGPVLTPQVPPPTLTYGPVLTPQVPQQAIAPLSPPASIGIPPVGTTPMPPPPVLLNSCTGGFCADAAGGAYNAGVGNAAVNSQGRLCNRVGNTIQCF